MASALALTALSAGCGGTGGAAQPSVTAAAARHAPIVSRCGSAVASAPSLHQVRTALVGLRGAPDGVATSPDGRWSFASLQGSSGRIVVSSDRSFVPRPLRTISLPGGGVSGLAVTHDGRLLAAAGRGAVVISVARATQGRSGAVLGRLMAPSSGAAAGGGGAEVAVSPDDRFAFVSLEGAGVIAVFDLRTAAADGFRGAGFVGTLKLGIAPLGLAVSPDGRLLYATSELAGGRAGRGDGSLTVIDLRRAESDPAHSVLAVAAVPCHPVRVAASPDRRFVWVTARTGNELYGFSLTRPLGQPRLVLAAAVPVGAEPIGLGVVNGGRRVMVADSNLLGSRGAAASLTVVDTAAALHGQPAVLGVIRAGELPSDVALAPNGHTLLVSDSGSDQLEAVDLTGLP